MPLESQQHSKEQKAEKLRHVDPAGYLSSKTIAALSSPTGGAICVLRVSGSQAFAVSGKLLNQNPDWFKSRHRKATKVRLKERSGKILDEAVVVPFAAPNSFTGEDVVEFFLHGSPIIAQKALDEFFEMGVRGALPGEFSFRAVKNGKLNLSQAEAIKELINAENDFALELSLEKLSGSQHELLLKIRDELLQLVTLAEAGIDFSDQDLDEVSLPTLKKRLASVAQQVASLGSSFDRGKKFLDGIPVSIFGLPNAGKSSFFNALLGEDRSIVSDIAGTTRDVVKEKLHLRSSRQNTVSFKISDTAGLRKSSDQIEEIGIERSLKSAKESDLIVVVIDGTNPSLEQIKNYFEQYLRDAKQPAQVIGVITKEDLLSDQQKLEIKKNVLQFSKNVTAWFFISSVNFNGIHEVATAMADYSEKLMERKPGEVLLTQFEHVRAAQSALETLNRANQSQDIVLFATDVRHAMNDLGPLLGETIPDDILGKIFSDFCIGK